MSSFDSVLFWLSTVAAAAAFFVSLMSLVLRKENAFKFAQYFIIFSFTTLTIHGLSRWIVSGHPPFVTFFESMTLSVWFLILAFFILQKFMQRSNLMLIPISLISFLLLGWAATLPKNLSPLSAALDNVWLFIHASFATCGASVFLMAASFSAVYLMGEEWLKDHIRTANLMPDYKSLPASILNFVIFGLILWGVMIVSGAIWAHGAWGRYWAWDPIELWSLISWLMYGLVLHSKLGFKVSTRIFCWLTISAAFAVVFALWGVGYIYETIHSYG